MSFPVFESPHAAAPFSRDAREIAELYFPDAPRSQIGGFTVVAGSNGAFVIVDELRSYWDTNSSGAHDPGELVFENYNLFVFVSRDTATLNEAFESFKPQDNDVCIFLEDNSGDTFSGATGWIRQSHAAVVVGPQVRDELSAWYGETRLAELRELGQRLHADLEFSPEQMRALLAEGELRDASASTAILLMQALNAPNVLAAPLYTAVADALAAITTFLRANIEFKDRHWDPLAGTGPNEGGAGAGTGETAFEPVLLPYSHRLIDELSALEDLGVQKVASELREALERRRRSLVGPWQRLRRAEGAEALAIGRGLSECLEHLARTADELIRRLADTLCQRIVPMFASLSKTWLNAVNAFICGLWNSLVESVLGLVDLLVAGLRVFAGVGEAMRDAQDLVPRTLELIDELMQTVQQVDLGALALKVGSAFLDMLARINLSSFFAGLSAERVAYFLGNLIGFVVESLIELFISGGTTKVLAAAAKFGDLAKTVYSFVEKGAKAALRSTRNAWEGVLALLGAVIDALRRGPDELVRMLEAAFEVVVRSGMLPDEAVARLYRMLGVGPAERNALEQAGMKFVAESGDSAFICNIMNAAAP